MKRYVVIVDDDPVLRLLISGFLGQSGWTCFCAKDPDEAIDILEREPVSCAIVDLHLGTRSGYEVIRNIVRRWPAIRIVAMSGEVLSRGVAAIAAGAAAFLEKPVRSLQEISNALEGGNRED